MCLCFPVSIFLCFLILCLPLFFLCLPNKGVSRYGFLHFTGWAIELAHMVFSGWWVGGRIWNGTCGNMNVALYLAGLACQDLIGLHSIYPQHPVGSATPVTVLLWRWCLPLWWEWGREWVKGRIGCIYRSVNISYIWGYTGIKIIICWHPFSLDFWLFSFCCGSPCLKWQLRKFRHNPWVSEPFVFDRTH